MTPPRIEFDTDAQWRAACRRQLHKDTPPLPLDGKAVAWSLYTAACFGFGVVVGYFIT